ncbi:hypothetical protein TEHN7126_1576 [Tetragenococcus halophilus subsp. halophilus]|uniref:FRG domain-containing protein n=1 Tax=Tetragenococcus halophilus TaxID=51669 RepID=UPI000CC39C91|nr:FRG domain-containing protein [Tetragenococcus halophilus]GBD73072.1 hypothetical protein TEHN7125_1232 [Tetragenococcus halophilus subsp. halophilus]GBD75877.1 hypothetical protein TEHN7126_1576 [Tetragenococcus halophilus subsp. halophilus]
MEVFKITSLEKRFYEWQSDMIECCGFNKEGNFEEPTQRNVDQFIWYRGASNYQYKLQTSFQRSSIVKKYGPEEYYKQMQHYINKMDNLKMLGYEGFDFAFLQHRGFPSPYLIGLQINLLLRYLLVTNGLMNRPRKMLLFMH